MGQKLNFKKNIKNIMQKYFVYFFFIFFLFANIKAEIVENFKISGNERVSSETIKIYGKLELNKNYNENDLNNVLRNLTKQIFLKM